MDKECEGAIMVMGMTGAGKSFFIDCLVKGSTTIGHSLRSETSGCVGVQVFRNQDDDSSPVIVVDTPGFGDTDRNDGEILDSITTYLAAQYASGIPLKGILFLHNITDNRVTGSYRNFLEIFRAICGDQALQNVVLVTTMWDHVTTMCEIGFLLLYTLGNFEHGPYT